MDNDDARTERTGPSGTAPMPAPLDVARRQLRTPWAASVAGLLFAGLFTLGLLLIRTSPMTVAGDEDLLRLFESGRDWPVLVGALYLVPFSGICFLWFIAVVRDQIGQREDQFFATVFLGSGLLFVGLLFTAAAIVSAPVVGARYLGQPPPSTEDVELVRSFAYTLLFGFATRAAAVFLFSTATITLRSGAFPRWVAWLGFVVGTGLLAAVAFWDWIILVLPAWVTLLSIHILGRQRSARREALIRSG